MIEIVRYEGQAGLAKEIWDVLTDVYGESPWQLEQIQGDLEQATSVYFLAYEGQDLQGFLAVQETDFELEITQIAVRKAAQRRGIAAALLAYLPKGKEVFLEVRLSNQGAQLFYTKNGFREIGRRKQYYHTPLEDALLMKRESDER